MRLRIREHVHARTGVRGDLRNHVDAPRHFAAHGIDPSIHEWNGSGDRPLLRIDQPVVAFDVSQNGERIAYVAGKVADAGKGKSSLTLRIQALAAGSQPLLVPLQPGEQVMSPSF